MKTIRANAKERMTGFGRVCTVGNGCACAGALCCRSFARPS